MERRKFLQATAVAGVGGIAGCQGDEEIPNDGTPTPEPSAADSTSTDKDEPTETADTVYYVTTDGSDSNNQYITKPVS